MACDSSNCQSNCYKSELEVEEEKPQRPNSHPNTKPSTCVKCKTNDATTGDFCRECFRANLYGKFKLAVTSNAMITPPDNVLVAFSGGSSSRVALQFVHEMQRRSQKNFDASKDKSLQVFRFGVAFIDESAYHSVNDKAIEEIKSIVCDLGKELHVFPIECVFSSDDGRERLKLLVDSVSDITGQEDLLLYLRMLALQKVMFLIRSFMQF